MEGRWGGRAPNYKSVFAFDRSKQNPEHTLTIEFNGDFEMRDFIKKLWWLGQAGASRDVKVEYEDDPFKGFWDGDGADKILSAKLDGIDILKKD